MHLRTSITTVENANLVGDSWRMSAHFEAFRGQVPVGAGPLTGQLHACALVLFNNLAQPKILHNAIRSSYEQFGNCCTHAQWVKGYVYDNQALPMINWKRHSRQASQCSGACSDPVGTSYPWSFNDQLVLWCSVTSCCDRTCCCLSASSQYHPYYPSGGEPGSCQGL